MFLYFLGGGGRKILMVFFSLWLKSILPIQTKIEPNATIVWTPITSYVSARFSGGVLNGVVQLWCGYSAKVRVGVEIFPQDQNPLL